MPAMPSTMSTSWLIETSSELPRLTGSALSPARIICEPCTQSSMYMKLRVCSPSPQISISWLPEIEASAILRQTAAGAFSRPPVQVPSGP